eukprot:3061735-Rhodomonas_salina.1
MQDARIPLKIARKALRQRARALRGGRKRKGKGERQRAPQVPYGIVYNETPSKICECHGVLREKKEACDSVDGP